MTIKTKNVNIKINEDLLIRMQDLKSNLDINWSYRIRDFIKEEVKKLEEENKKAHIGKCEL